MQRSQRVVRKRNMLLAVVAVASGVTISCGCGGIGLYDPGWDAAFDAAAKDASRDADAANDGSSDSAFDAGDATHAGSD